MTENGSEEGLLLRAEPLGLSEDVSRRMVDVVRVADGALLLDADLAWAEAINTVLVSKGVRVKEIRKETAQPSSWPKAGSAHMKDDEERTDL